MHIAVVTRTFDPADGTGSVNYSTVERALARGHQLTVISQDEACMFGERAGLTHIPIRVSSLPTDVLQSIAFAPMAARWINRHRHEIDFVHVNGDATLCSSDLNTSHFVFTRWLESAEWRLSKRSPRLAYQRFYARFNSWAEQIAYSRAEQIVAVSERIREELISIGVDAARIIVVENGIDIDKFCAREPNRARFGLPEGVPLLAFAGDIVSARKNVDALFDLLVDIPELHLAIAGGLEGSPYPDRARQRGIADRVHFIGFERDMPAFLACADLFVFLSHYEPFGLVIPQALAMGVPVVTTESVGASRLVESETGVILPSRPSRLLVFQTVQRLLADTATRSAMSSQAMTAARRFSVTTMADRYVDLYEGKVAITDQNALVAFSG